MSGERVFYHLCPITVQPGSILSAGNFGRILKLYGAGALNEMFVREYIYERIRKDEHPEKPSRMHCIFTCESKRDAQEFRARNLNGFWLHKLLAVTPVLADTPTHRASYFLQPPQENIWEGYESAARAYWTDEPQQMTEVIIGGDVRVIEVCQ